MLLKTQRFVINIMPVIKKISNEDKSALATKALLAALAVPADDFSSIRSDADIISQKQVRLLTLLNSKKSTRAETLTDLVCTCNFH